MADRVLIPLPAGQWLALDREVFEKALAEGAACMGAAMPSSTSSTAEPLLDAEKLASALALPVSWLEQAAREHRIPSVQAGRWRRFSRPAVERALSANGKQR